MTPTPQPITSENQKIRKSENQKIRKSENQKIRKSEKQLNKNKKQVNVHQFFIDNLKHVSIIYI
jgi:hypothetical protein